VTVAAVTMVRDEGDVLEGTLRAMLREVDLVIVADNLSTDDTPAILERLAAEHPQLIVTRDAEPGYFQARKMTHLAAEAEAFGADIVVPFDADERWYSPHGRVADVLADSGGTLFPALVYDHIPTALDPDGPPFHRMGWRRREANPLVKVAARTRPAVRIHQGNHGADYGPTIRDLLVVRHYPYRSAEQFVRKARNGAAAYAATDLPEHEGRHWRDYGRILDEEGEDALTAVFHRWFWSPDPRRDRTLILDPSP
jgi:glycosyltransferase involved in cell wall biosynthesis